jgi:hypothetical protein
MIAWHARSGHAADVTLMKQMSVFFSVETAVPDVRHQRRVIDHTWTYQQHSSSCNQLIRIAQTATQT